ncbi:heterokaryon incompatibility protein-domain-containing protein [Macrophomina phaseolina]|uniref:Heterokaryon incompatibility protein-domain-containing protein n=1 Tax=Macrophomina phaseolina TaxID=35725 RepID=A0ABQ8FXX0_9PEZI|nr:heterokaryon incompatibility protein-domain-containing protein [Macrophomina phaseolina]
MYRRNSPQPLVADAVGWFLEHAPEAAADLCARCEEALSLSASDSKLSLSVHHHSAGGFFDAAERSCLVCGYLCGKLPWKAEYLSPKTLESKVPGAPFSTYSVRPNRIEFRLEWLGESYIPGKGLVWSFPYPLNGNASSEVVVDNPTYGLNVHFSTCTKPPAKRLPIPSSIGLAERAPQIIAWIHECERDHSICRSLKPAAAAYVPTRLLDLGTSKGSEVRLREAHECPSPCRYVTLSHCWGARKDWPPRLLMGNYQQMRDGLPKIPRTLLEAIDVSRLLGVRYVWIDSLCIIQDDPEDWRSEAARMAEVYSNSFCNIAATGSRNGSGGLYFQRNPRLEPPWTLYLKQPTSANARRAVISCDIPLDDEFGAAPLNSRAWALQERLLAPRTLHFGRKRLYWECCHSFTWEGNHQGARTVTQLNGSYQPAWVSPFIDVKLAFAALKLQSCQAETLQVQPVGREADAMSAALNLWEFIVETYCKCSLSKKTDKLIALSGIATSFQPLLQDDYLAGIWRSHGARQLLWKRSRGSSASDRDNDRAPSWSWASVDSPIVYPSLHHHSSDDYQAHIERHTFSGVDTARAPRASDFIEVRGKFERASLADRASGMSAGSRQLIVRSHRQVPTTVVLEMDVDEQDDVIDGDFPEYFLLALASYKQPSRNSRTVEGIVLERAYTSRVKDSFQRVGVFTREYDGEFLALPEKLVRIV